MILIHWNPKMELLYKTLTRTPHTVTELKYKMATLIRTCYPDDILLKTPNEQSIKRWLDWLIKEGLVAKEQQMKGKRKMSVYTKTNKEARLKCDSKT